MSRPRPAPPVRRSRTLKGVLVAVALGVIVAPAPAAAQLPIGPLNDLAALGQGEGQTPAPVGHDEPAAAPGRRAARGLRAARRTAQRPDKASWTGRRDHAVILLAAQTGLRASELIRLSCSDINRVAAAMAARAARAQRAAGGDLADQRPQLISRQAGRVCRSPA